MVIINCPNCGRDCIEETGYEEFKCTYCEREFTLNEASYEESEVEQ